MKFLVTSRTSAGMVAERRTTLEDYKNQGDVVETEL